MSKLLFLGTGPAGGTKYGQKGKSKRLESSALVKIGEYRILIDVTTHFFLQSKKIDRIDAIFITHGHIDAIGGIGKLEGWLNKHDLKVPLYSLSKTIEIIKRRNPNTTHLEFQPFASYKNHQFFDLTVTPFPVEHSIQKGFPTLGFQFKNERTMVYVSDTSGWSEKAENIMKYSDILVIDGAMWNMRMPAHLDIVKILPRLCKWKNKEIIFTQIGNTAPPYEILEKEIKKICSKAKPAYDGMQINF